MIFFKQEYKATEKEIIDFSNDKIVKYNVVDNRILTPACQKSIHKHDDGEIQKRRKSEDQFRPLNPSSLGKGFSSP